jgi:hypothetical protein
MNSNAAGTAIGGVLAIGNAIQPVLNGVNGSMHTQDWVNLAFSALMALYGWYSRTHGKGGFAVPQG